MHYEITIHQNSSDYSWSQRWSETYNSLDALKAAFGQVNSETLFGPTVSQNITPNWESDCYSNVVRKKNNVVTSIVTTRVAPRNLSEVKVIGAFAFELGQHLIRH